LYLIATGCFTHIGMGHPMRCHELLSMAPWDFRTCILLKSPRLLQTYHCSWKSPTGYVCGTFVRWRCEPASWFFRCSRSLCRSRTLQKFHASARIVWVLDEPIVQLSDVCGIVLLGNLSYQPLDEEQMLPESCRDRLWLGWKAFAWE
jgi:hypothetical protein